MMKGLLLLNVNNTVWHFCLSKGEPHLHEPVSKSGKPREGVGGPPSLQNPVSKSGKPREEKKLDAVGKGQTSSKKEVLPNKGQKGGQKGSRILP